MQLTGEQTIAAPRQRVWDALNDPAILQQCIPGCQSLERDGDRMNAVVAIKIGPIGARFNGKLAITDQKPPESCTIEGEGQGGNAGVAQGKADVVLTEGDGGTVLAYSVEAQVGGRLAQVGGALIDATAKRLAGTFFKKFGAIVEAPDEADATSSQPAAAKPDSAPNAPPQATAAASSPPPSAPVAGSVSDRGAPVAWLLAVALAALIGFLVGRGDGGSDWMAIAVALLILGVAGAAFSIGRRSATQIVQIDPRQLADLLRGGRP